MGRLLTCVLAIGFVSSGLLFQNSRTAPGSIEVQMATDGAFRDGLYLGKLDLAAGRTVTPPTARWSTEKDRASFVSGYRQGFNQTQRK